MLAKVKILKIQVSGETGSGKSHALSEVRRLLASNGYTCVSDDVTEEAKSSAINRAMTTTICTVVVLSEHRQPHPNETGEVICEY